MGALSLGSRPGRYGFLRADGPRRGYLSGYPQVAFQLAPGHGFHFAGSLAGEKNEPKQRRCRLVEVLQGLPHGLDFVLVQNALTAFLFSTWDVHGLAGVRGVSGQEGLLNGELSEEKQIK